MTTQRIDFAVVKEQASFSAVLDRYGIKHQNSHGRASVLCPFHDDHKPSLSVDFEQKLFHCFSCEEKGSILDFVAKMEKVTLFEAARMIADWCGLTANGKRSLDFPVKSAEEVNRPLGFTLQLDPTHPYLAERGLTPEIIDTFGLGYCGKGLHNGRIAIPIHDASGNLVAYAGRWASDGVPEGTPKYMLPKGFRKNHVLFNYHRVAAIVCSVGHVFIVEGYWSVFRLHDLGVPAVALMGGTLSEEQEMLLVRAGARTLILLLDADEPGRAATAELLPRLSRRFFVRAPRLPKTKHRTRFTRTF